MSKILNLVKLKASLFRVSFSIIILVAFATALFSCASRYHSLRPESIRYNEPLQENELHFSYMYNVLSYNGNKKYAKRELKKGINLVAIKFTNTTANNISFPNDVQLIAGGHAIFPIDRELVRKELKQGVPIYLLYSLLFVTVVDDCGPYGGCETSVYPVGLGIAGFNIILAATANKNFANELEQYDIMNRVIAPGETVYGLIGIQSMGYAPLTVELK